MLTDEVNNKHTESDARKQFLKSKTLYALKHHLSGHLPCKPVLAGLAALSHFFLTRGFGAKFYGSDAPPHTNQQKHSGIHLFYIYYNS